MGNIFDISSNFTGSSAPKTGTTTTGTKKKRNIFDINEFISTYKPEPAKTVAPVTTTTPAPTTTTKTEPVKTTPVQTTAPTQKDYFNVPKGTLFAASQPKQMFGQAEPAKAPMTLPRLEKKPGILPIMTEPVQPIKTEKETQMQKLDTPAQPAKKWDNMPIKDNIIPYAKDFTPKPVKQDSDKETVKKGIAADWKNIWDGISQRFLGTSSMFFTNPVANSAQNQMLGAIGGKIAEVTTGDKTASYQGASEQAYKELKAEQLTPEYKKEQENRQAAIDKAANIVDKWAEKNKATSTISAGLGGLEQGTKNLVKGLDGALYKDELFGIKTYDSGGVLSKGYQQAAQDNKGLEKLLGDLTYSMGNMAPTMLVGSIAGSPGLGALLMGVGSAQGNYEDKRRQYADTMPSNEAHNKALIYGVLTGASEGALQYFIGSIPGLSTKSTGGALIKSPIARKLVSVVDDVFELSSKSPVVQGIVKTAVNSTVDISGEALEEGLQEYVYAGLNRLLFDEKQNYFGKGGLLETSAYSAFLGGLTAGILGVPGNISTNSIFKKEARSKELQAEVDKFQQRVREQVPVSEIAGAQTTKQGAQIETDSKFIAVYNDNLTRQIAEETDPTIKAGLQQALDEFNAMYIPAEISTKTPQIGDNALGVQVDAQQALDTTTPTVQGVQDTETQPVTQPQTTDNIFDLKLTQNTAEPMAVAEQPQNENLTKFQQEVDTAKADIQSRTDLSEEEKADVLAHIDTVYSEITAQTAEPVKQEVSPAEKVYTTEQITPTDKMARMRESKKETPGFIVSETNSNQYFSQEKITYQGKEYPRYQLAKYKDGTWKVLEAEKRGDSIVYKGEIVTDYRKTLKTAKQAISDLNKYERKAWVESKYPKPTEQMLKQKTGNTVNFESDYETKYKNEVVWLISEMGKEKYDSPKRYSLKRQLDKITLDRENHYIALGKKLFNRTIEFVDSLDDDSNGQFDPNTGVITISRSSVHPLLFVFAHEITHSFQGTKAYDELKSFVIKSVGSDIYSSEIKRLTDLYMNNYGSLTDEYVQYEFVANYVAEHLITQESDIYSLANTNKALATRIYNWINNIILKLKGTNEERSLLKAKKLYQKALSSKGAVGDTASKGDNITMLAIPPSGNTVNRVGKLKSESTEKLYLAGEKYGFHNPTYKKMPLPLRMDETDKRMVGKTINTILRTDWVNNSGAKDLADDIVSGKATYQRITDKFAEKKAREIITTGSYDDALSIWDGKIAENKRMTKIDIVMAELILEQAAKQGDNTLVRKLVSEVAMIATETGQVSQAINIFNKLSGNSQLRAAEMLAKRLNKMFQERLDKLGSVIEVNKALAEELKKATTEEEKQRIQEEIRLDLIDQLPPATFREKWDAWRMTSMLGNLRTGIRNLAGNTLFVPPIMAKNFLAFAMEEATNKAVVDKITKIAEKIKTTKDTNEVVRLLAKASGDKTYYKRMTDTLDSTTNKMAQKALIDTEIANLNERVQFNRGIIKTKALKADKDAKDFAADDFQYVQVVLQGSGKYELSHKGIFESRKIFNSKVTDKLGFGKVKLDKLKLKGKTLQDFASLEGYRKNTIYMLEDSPIGDKRYLAMHYKRALSGFLTANKVDMDAVKVAQEAINEGNTLDTYAAKMLQIGREYAIKEAQEATFRNKNKLADSLNDFADNHGIAADVIINGALPFKKTPVNILYRGLEYSPAGLAKTLTIDSVRLKRGDIDVTDYINKLAKGITGTGVVLLGMGLAAAGILSGDLSDDETERKLQEQQGFQKYSLKVGDTWYSIDWAAPISLPLFLGVEILKIYEQHNGLQYKDITEGLINMTAPVINMSMLSGISEMISNLRYKTTPQAALASLPITAVRGYFTQGIPTLLGQAARTADGTRRTMSTAEDDQLNADQQYFKQKIKSKIPGVSNQAEPYLDIWGIEEPKKNILSRGAENFLSPGYVKNSKSDNLAKIMLDLKGKATPDLGVSVMPFIPDRTLTYDTKEYSLTASQLTEIRRLTGAAQQAAASAFLEKNKPVKLTYDNKNKVAMTSSVTLLNAQNKSGGKYSNEDIQIKALAKTMKDAREKAVADFIKAHKDLQIKK